MSMSACKRLCAVVLFLITMAILQSGCGGGGGNNTSGTGRAALSITWPSRSRLIPVASNSIRIIFTQNGTVLANQLVPRPAAGGASSITVNNLKVGALVMAATAYPNADGTGAAQASGSTTINIADNQTTNVTLTMNSTIDHLEVTPSPLTVVANANVQVVATAKDASGAIVLTTPGKFTYDSSIKTVATIDTNGLLHGVAGGSSQITVVETESSKQVVVTANVTSAPGANAIYITDKSRLIRMDDMNGANWTEFVGTGDPFPGGYVPNGVYVDNANHIYGINDNGTGTPVYRMDNMAGAGVTSFTSAALFWARKIALDKQGKIVIMGAGYLARMDDMQGTGFVLFTGPAAEPQYNWDPQGIAFDSQNRIYVADAGGTSSPTPPRIIRMDNITGANMVVLDGTGKFDPTAVAVDSTDRIYIADFLNATNGRDRIIRVDDMTGTNQVTYGAKGSGVGQFFGPNSISFDSMGRIYISDRVNHRIVRMDDMTGANWTSYGSYGSDGTGVGHFWTLAEVYVR
jgi:hypothetical protein